MGAWIGKPCQRCGKQKGKKQRHLKYCWTCNREVQKEQSRGAHAKAIFERYGLTIDEYNGLYELQGGRCALCRIATGRTRRLSVDHDHKTGDVRGLLCRPCNTLLGRVRDSIAFFRRCIDYLDNPPFRRLNDGEDWPYD